MTRRLRRGQAMVEAVLAVLIVTSVFLALFKLSHMLTAKILLEHAAMRVARARAVGFNEFMCRKSARLCVIPIAGKRTWPTGADAIDWSMELARMPTYLITADESIARGVLEYEGWGRLKVDRGDGTDVKTTLGVSLFDGWGDFTLQGNAGIERNADFYMIDQGL